MCIFALTFEIVNDIIVQKAKDWRNDLFDVLAEVKVILKDFEVII